jgi:hypothetical protein
VVFDCLMKAEVMTQPADMVRYPRRRDIRTGSADPVPPTGMIPIVPLVPAPTGDPLPTRRELRTGSIQCVPQPAPEQPGAKAAAPGAGPDRRAQPRPRRGWYGAAAAAVVVVAAAVLLWLQFAA